MSSRQSAIALAAISSVCSSLAWVFQGAAVALLTPISVAALQDLFSGAIYLLHLGPNRRTLPIKKIKAHTKEILEFALLRGVIGSILICYALDLSGSIKVMFFTKLEPYFILFWSWLLLGQKITRNRFLLLLVHVCGAILLSVGGVSDLGRPQFGDLLVVAAAAIFAYSYLHAAKLSRELGPIHVNGVSVLLAGLCLLPIAIFTSPWSVWNPLSMGWLNILILVLLFNVVGQTMWYWSLQHLEGWLVSALRAVGPVFAAPFAWLFFDQSLTELQLMGAAIVLITSAQLAREQKKQVLPADV